MQDIKSIETLYNKVYGLLKELVFNLQKSPNDILSLEESLYDFFIRDNSIFDERITSEEFIKNKSFYKLIMKLIVISKSYQYIIYKIENQLDESNSKHKLCLLNELSMKNIPALFSCLNLVILYIIQDFVEYVSANYILKSICRDCTLNNPQYKKHLIELNPYELLDGENYKNIGDLSQAELLLNYFLSTCIECKMTAQQDVFKDKEFEEVFLYLFNFDMFLQFNLDLNTDQDSKIINILEQSNSNNDSKTNYISFICSKTYEALLDREFVNQVAILYGQLIYDIKKTLEEKNINEIIQRFKNDDKFAYTLIELCFMAYNNISETEFKNRLDNAYKDKKSLGVIEKLDPYFKENIFRKRNN